MNLVHRKLSSQHQVCKDLVVSQKCNSVVHAELVGKATEPDVSKPFLEVKTWYSLDLTRSSLVAWSGISKDLVVSSGSDGVPQTPQGLDPPGPPKIRRDPPGLFRDPPGP